MTFSDRNWNLTISLASIDILAYIHVGFCSHRRIFIAKSTWFLKPETVLRVNLFMNLQFRDGILLVTVGEWVAFAQTNCWIFILQCWVQSSPEKTLILLNNSKQINSSKIFQYFSVICWKENQMSYNLCCKHKTRNNDSFCTSIRQNFKRFITRNEKNVLMQSTFCRLIDE